VSERLLTARELAELLGFSPATIVDWAEAGKLPAFKIGGRLRFREREVVEWLEGQRAGRPEEKLSTTPHGRPARGVVSLTSTTPHRGGEEDAC
jgi:excisionase family DNA binding protein